MNEEVRVRCTKDGISVVGARDIGSTSDTRSGSLSQFLRIAECWWNTYCEESPKPDPDWKTTCEKCKDGEILPDNCEYFGEPNGCNSPLYGQHPKENHGNLAAMREALEMMSSLFDKGVICTSYANSPEEMEQIKELYLKAKAALSEPPRNCDRFGGDEDELFDCYIHEGKCCPYKYLFPDYGFWLLRKAKAKGDATDGVQSAS